MPQADRPKPLIGLAAAVRAGLAWRHWRMATKLPVNLHFPKTTACGTIQSR